MTICGLGAMVAGMMNGARTLQGQIIGAMARAVAGSAWASSGLCGYVFGTQRVCDAPERHPMHGPDDARKMQHEFRPREWSRYPHAPTQAERDIAAIFYGMVMQANGPWEKIIAAAVPEYERQKGHVCGSCEPCENCARRDCRGECITRQQLPAPSFNSSAFASALILEGLWRGRGEASGPSWFDEHAEFRVPETREHMSVSTRRFIVPPLVVFDPTAEAPHS